MEWCRCEQRPPLPDSALCFLCDQKSAESPQDRIGEQPIDDAETTLRTVRGVVYAGCLSCLVIVLGIGIFLGWAARSLWD